eukprot:CAMPEP_0197056366 /NCGR_PEP_ID=MMETSP1384-20130603/83433_1 /TAXON_ID=29189 /ORGANISM="Ammonia sp." /LENGTH=405 /DNA_ID=CAMNT_0042490319 /DNA_START=37 /DNA_END=1254 /DNA_ORIENTATION=-
MKRLRRCINKPKNFMISLCQRRLCGPLLRLCCTKQRVRYVEDVIINILDFVINKGMRVLGPLLASAATCLISLVVYEYFQEVFPYLRQVKYVDTAPYMPYLITLLGIFLLVNVVFNHQSCVWTSPGYGPLSIPKYPKGTQEIPGKYYKYDPELKSSAVIRYCNQCQCYKPWRAHHCSICKRCVLKMDHHCPWMWNCVGYANYRYFYMFLFYLWMGTLFYIYHGYDPLFESFRVKSCAYPWLPFFLCRIARIRYRLVPTDKLDEMGNPIQDRVLVERNELFVFTYFLCIGICIVMVAFLGFHSYLVLSNQSTLETMTNFSKKARSIRRFQRLRDVKCLYHLSLKENVKEIFGEKWYLALLPIWTKPRGNGFIYPLRKEINDVLFTSKSEAEPHDLDQSSNDKMSLP